VKHRAVDHGGGVKTLQRLPEASYHAHDATILT